MSLRVSLFRGKHAAGLLLTLSLPLVCSADSFGLASIKPIIDPTSVGLYNTGEASSGVTSTPGAVDPHYTDPVSPVYVLISPASVWVQPDAAAKYVAPDTGDGSSIDSGTYTRDYSLNFDLTGYDPGSVVITGKWATDNFGNDILLNGVSTGNTSAGFNAFSSFTLNSGFHSGINTLDFNWGDGGGPGGLLVEFNSFDASPAVNTSAPEPATMAFGGIGLLAIGLFTPGRPLTRESPELSLESFIPRAEHLFHCRLSGIAPSLAVVLPPQSDPADQQNGRQQPRPDKTACGTGVPALAGSGAVASKLVLKRRFRFYSDQDSKRGDELLREIVAA